MTRSVAPIRAAALAILAATAAAASRSLAKPLYGVNIGSWLLVEPYLLPNEWVHRMGGDWGCDCLNESSCAASEYALVKKLGQARANQAFQQHYDTWLTQADVRQIAAAGLNTVRIPVGFWVVPETKDSADYFPDGGMPYLTRGLGWFADANISVVIDMHGVPGQHVRNTALTGRCTLHPTFYLNNDHNFNRTAIAFETLTRNAHTLHEWRSVVGLQLLNEVQGDVKSLPTPTYGQYLTEMTATIRDTEAALAKASDPLTIIAMDYTWQYNGPHVNPASVLQGKGPAAYDNHLYLSFGGLVVPPTKEGYLDYICHNTSYRIDTDNGLGNNPLFFGEWWLATEPAVKPDAEFYRNFGDAQRLIYQNSASGWMFWSWKSESIDTAHSYRDAIAAGLLPKTDPGHITNPHICDGRR